MAKMIKRGVIGDLSGKIGQIILRRVPGGKTQAVTPAIRTKPRSPKQLERQDLFRKATRYAQQTQVRRPEVWKIYQSMANRPYMSPNNIAIKDFMSLPVIDEVDLTDYHGRAGDPIYIEAHDNVQVAKVTVRITDKDSGNLLEQGEAQAHNKRDWSYRVRRDVSGGSGGVMVEVRVWDLAGHEVREVKPSRRPQYRHNPPG